MAYISAATADWGQSGGSATCTASSGFPAAFSTTEQDAVAKSVPGWSADPSV
jgi:hypothetical protein